MKRKLISLTLLLCALPQFGFAATRVVITANNYLPDGITVAPGSLLEALQMAGAGDTITFLIPGVGPHVIQTPLGGYPLIAANNLIIDGYTQPLSSPNTNSILQGNNAQIKIVLDSTGADTAANPGNPSLPLRRSTRLDFPAFPGNTGYGTSENAILGVFEADNVTIRGLSFIARRTPGTDDDPAIYCVALVKQATNAHVQGCWFGLPPGGSTMADVKPGASAVAAFRWRIGGDVYSEGAVIGTDGDGVNDRAEFNVMVGGRVSMALELPRARISGNYVNVFPDGLHFVDLDASYKLWTDVFAAGGADPADVTIENFENGRVTDDTIIGTDGNGVSDADERNVFGHVVYDHLLEFYSSSQRAVIAGNYFGIGVDGLTPAPLSTNVTPDFAELGGAGSVRVGSNGDGVSDNVEGNVIFNVPGARYVIAGGSTPIVTRWNQMVNNSFKAVPFADNQNSSYISYYSAALADSSAGVVPVIQRYTNGILSGKFAAPSAAYPNTVIDLYLVDPLALANDTYWPDPVVHPRQLLASFKDNGPGDLNPNPNEFSFDLRFPGPFGPSTYFAVAVSYSQDAGSFNVERAITSPMSNPVSARPSLRLRFSSPSEVQLSWLAPEGAFTVEANDSLNPNTWLEPFVSTQTYTSGRTLYTKPYEPGFAPIEYYRLVSH